MMTTFHAADHDPSDHLPEPPPDERDDLDNRETEGQYDDLVDPDESLSY